MACPATVGLLTPHRPPGLVGVLSVRRLCVPEYLRTTVVIDYQNVHLVGRSVFDKYLPKHETLVDPALYAGQLVFERNRRQRDGYVHAVLAKVLVYRGEPSAEHDPTDYARSQSQKSHWEMDARVHVTLRPLKYEYQRDAQGRPATLHDGSKIVTSKREKGVDVLCALAAVREARSPGTDLVILASSDSDLAPAIDEVLQLRMAKIETTSWYDPVTRVDRALRGGATRVWNTRLTKTHFEAARDRTAYGSTRFRLARLPGPPHSLAFPQSDRARARGLLHQRHQQRPRTIAQGGFPAAPDYFPHFLIVSTTPVFGQRCAVFTGMNFPLPASRPILVPLANSLTSLRPSRVITA